MGFLLPCHLRLSSALRRHARVIGVRMTAESVTRRAL